MPDQPTDHPPTLAELADRFGSWRNSEDDAEITVPPTWTRGADLDGPDDGRAGSAYVVGAFYGDSDHPGHEVAERGAVAEWRRVLSVSDGTATHVAITGDDAVEIIGNDVRTIRRPAGIEVGSWLRLTPLGACRLVDALMRAVELVTDHEHAYSAYIAASTDAASIGRLVLADRGIPTSPDPEQPEQPGPLEERYPNWAGAREMDRELANDPAPAEPVIDRAAAVCTCPDSWHHPLGKHHPDACPIGAARGDTERD